MKQRRIAQTNNIEALGPWDLEPTRMVNGFDALHRAGVINGRYAPCYTELRIRCTCYGCQHDDEVPGMEAQIVERRRGSSLYLARMNGRTRRQS